MSERKPASLTADEIAEVRNHIASGDLDAPAIALEYGVGADMIRGLRAGLQAEWFAANKGRLPVPPPSNGGYRARPFTESDHLVRNDFLTDENATITGIAKKYSLSTSAARHILDKNPSMLAAKFHKEANGRAAFHAAVLVHLRAAKLPENEIMIAVGRTDLREALVEIINDTLMGPEYKTYNRKRAYQGIVWSLSAGAWRPTWEQFNADWDRFDRLPHYRDERLLPD